MKFGNIVRVGTFDIDEDHDDAEARFLQLSIRLRYYYYVQLVATRRDWMRVPNLKIWSLAVGLDSRADSRLRKFSANFPASKGATVIDAWATTLMSLVNNGPPKTQPSCDSGGDFDTARRLV